MNSLTETIDHVKVNLMPDYDYDEFDRDPYVNDYGDEEVSYAAEDEKKDGWDR